MRHPALAFVSVLFAASVAAAAPDLSRLPGMGETAPAFGLLPLNPAKGKEADVEAKQAVELDHHCGIRSAETKAVIVYFFDLTSAQADLDVLQGWAKKYQKQGLRTLAISEHNPHTDVTPLVEKGRYAFPVLDDHLGIVAQRYGVPGGPFFFLLDGQCKLIAFSDKSVAAEKVAIGTGIDALLTNKLQAPVQ